MMYLNFLSHDKDEYELKRSNNLLRCKNTKKFVKILMKCFDSNGYFLSIFSNSNQESIV